MSTLSAQVGIDLSLIKSQLHQLKALHDAGTLTVQAYTDARSALAHRLLDWVLREPPAESVVRPLLPGVARATPHRRKLAALTGVVLVTALAASAYFWMGHTPTVVSNAIAGDAPVPPADATPKTGAAPHATNVEQISVMAERLAARLKTQPNDPQGWAMLARSYAVMGNQPEALAAYEKAVAMLPNDTALLADYAEALATTSKNNAAAQSFKLPRTSAGGTVANKP